MGRQSSGREANTLTPAVQRAFAPKQSLGGWMEIFTIRVKANSVK
jgi:hypothetical protein